MNKENKMQLKLMTGLILFSSQCLSVSGLKLTDKPLFINQTVPPALAITFDDSGSMQRTYMPDSRSIANYPSFTSPDYNFLYYNPEFEYQPPMKADGSLLPQADFFNAKLDGFHQSGDLVPRIDLSKDYKSKLLWNLFVNYDSDYANVIYMNANIYTYDKAYYHLYTGPTDATPAEMFDDHANYQLIYISGTKQQQNFANWYEYYNTRMKLARSALSHAFVNLGANFKIDWQQINANRFSQKAGNMKLFSGEHRNNFYQWLYFIDDTGNTPLRRATMDVGEMFKRSGANSLYYDKTYKGELSCQQNFHISISDGSWNSTAGLNGNIDATSSVLPSTPDGESGSNVLIYRPNSLPEKMYSDSESSTLSDNAFYYWSRDLRPDLINNVPVFIKDYTNSNGDIINLPQQVEWWNNKELFWNPQNNPASWQHLVNFNIGLGIEGILDKNKDLPSIRNGTLTWPDPYSSYNAKVDDVWHASLNSRGDFFEARNSKELTEALNSIIDSIIKRIGRASSGSVSSSIISDGSLSYKTGFDSSNWSGFLYSTRINNDGSAGEILWDAACKLTGGFCNSTNSMVSATSNDSNRTIFVYDKENSQQSSFNLSKLSSNQIESLLDSPYYNQFQENSGQAPFTTEDIIKYIRGNRSNEIQFGGVLRNRQSLLADIIHSSAKVIRGPSANYRDEFWPKNSAESTAANNGKGYEDYRLNMQDRKSIILAGANDGMLHAFDSGIDNDTSGGDEKWAFIPSQALKGLSEIANPNYSHRSFVDATPIVKDAFIDNQWTTVALGGMRYGGKLFYALDLGADLTMEPKVLWEFTDQDDSDMGFSYAGGLITRVAVPDGSTGLQSKWVAIIPNGYNSKNHQSALFVIDLQTGELLHKWQTSIGSASEPNGMGPPVAADFVVYDSSDTSKTYYGADQGTDFIYAGDLAGNVYRFDSKDIFTGNNQAEILFEGSFQQPITVAPRLYTPEDGSENIVVVFGTGKYIDLDDRSNNQDNKHYLYGLKDSKDSISMPYNSDDSRLIEQTLKTNDNRRSVSSKPVSSANSWKLMLPEDGERMVNSIVRNNQSKTLIATTLIPNTGDPCLAGGKSWVMVLNALSGGVPSIGNVFDNNSDGILVDDMVLGVNTLTTPGGNQQFLNIDTSADEGASQLTVQLDSSTSWRRRSWHRIIFN